MYYKIKKKRNLSGSLVPVAGHDIKNKKSRDNNRSHKRARIISLQNLPTSISELDL